MAAEDMPEGAVVLGSDTVVAADGKILGKPKSHEEAYLPQHQRLSAPQGS